MSEKDNFLINKIYPDPYEIFSNEFKPVSFSSDCIVVLDTNALLLPYTLTKESLEGVKMAYGKLIESKRLFIPAQVSREFAKNRPEKIKELYSNLKKKMNACANLQMDNFPILESLEPFRRLKDHSKKINVEIDAYRKEIQALLEIIKKWNWNDPVSSIYNEIFTNEMIVSPQIEDKILLDDLRWRNENKVPPGYKDGGESDEGIGDLLIWQTIIELGKHFKKPTIFITGEEKADWWYRSENDTIYPRYELSMEYHRSSNGENFAIQKLSDLLKEMGAQEKLVTEVRQEEISNEGFTNYISNNMISNYFGGFRSIRLDFGTPELVHAQRNAISVLFPFMFNNKPSSKEWGFLILPNEKRQSNIIIHISTTIIAILNKNFGRELSEDEIIRMAFVFAKDELRKHLMVGNFQDSYEAVITTDKIPGSINSLFTCNNSGEECIENLSVDFKIPLRSGFTTVS